MKEFRCIVLNCINHLKDKLIWPRWVSERNILESNSPFDSRWSVIILVQLNPWFAVNQPKNFLSCSESLHEA